LPKAAQASTYGGHPGEQEGGLGELGPKPGDFAAGRGHGVAQDETRPAGGRDFEDSGGGCVADVSMGRRSASISPQLRAGCVIPPLAGLTWPLALLVPRGAGGF
jgi:hypothetical protein